MFLFFFCNFQNSSQYAIDFIVKSTVFIKLSFNKIYTYEKCVVSEKNPNYMHSKVFLKGISIRVDVPIVVQFIVV